VLAVAEMAAASLIAAMVFWPTATSTAIVIGILGTTAYFAGKYAVLPLLAACVGSSYNPWEEEDKRFTS